MFTTEQDIKEQCYNTLYSKLASEAKGKEIDARQVRRMMETPEWQQWIAARVEDARKTRRLLTPIQAADFRAGRGLQEGDRVRYVGPTRLEPSRTTKRMLMRPHGQTGTVIKVFLNASGVLMEFEVMPDITPEVRKAAEVSDIEIMSIRTHAWIEFERIP